MRKSITKPKYILCKGSTANYNRTLITVATIWLTHQSLLSGSSHHSTPQSIQKTHYPPFFRFSLYVTFRYLVPFSHNCVWTSLSRLNRRMLLVFTITSKFIFQEEEINATFISRKTNIHNKLNTDTYRQYRRVYRSEMKMTVKSTKPRQLED